MTDECDSCERPDLVYSTADVLIARVLEQSATPLHIWDIQRLTSQTPWLRPATTTVSQTLGNRQFCWAGRSLYGLYRHGLLPGARSLWTVAGTVVHLSERQLSPDEIGFVLRSMGYRHAVGSLRPALNTAWTYDLCTAHWDGTYSGRPHSAPEQRQVARALGFPRRGRAFHAVIDRARQQITSALSERARRL